MVLPVMISSVQKMESLRQENGHASLQEYRFKFLTEHMVAYVHEADLRGGMASTLEAEWLMRLSGPTKPL